LLICKSYYTGFVLFTDPWTLSHNRGSGLPWKLKGNKKAISQA